MNIKPVLIANFGPPALACIRSWGEKGCKVGFICIAPANSPLPKSKYLDSVTILTPEMRFKPEGLELIGKYLEEFHATGLVAISEDVSCWLYDNQNLLPAKVSLWINKSDSLHKLVSKKKQIEFAKDAGFNVLPTYFIMNSDDVELIDNSDYPLCLRPSCPMTITPSFKVQHIADKSMLLEFIGKIEKIEEAIVAQPFLVLPNLNIHASRSDSGELLGVQSFIVNRKFKGVSLTFKPYYLNEDLFEKIIYLSEKLEVRGPFDIEFLYDKEKSKIYFIELNNRFGGATAKAFACGYDEPYYALKAYGVDCGSPRKMRSVVVASRQAAFKCFLGTWKQKLTPFDYPDESKYKRFIFLLWAFITHYDDIFSIRDLKGSLSLYYTNLKTKIIRSER